MSFPSFRFRSSQPLFFPEIPESRFLRRTISSLFPIDYSLICKSRKNNYQLSSTFDKCLKESFVKHGIIGCLLNLPSEIHKQYDFAFTIESQKVVFEVEKANHEKILYDFLKAHIYLNSGASFVVLVLPMERGRSLKTKSMFEIAKEHREHCVRFGMGSDKLFERILLVGFDQCFEDRPFDDASRANIREKCRQALK